MKLTEINLNLLFLLAFLSNKFPVNCTEPLPLLWKQEGIFYAHKIADLIKLYKHND